MADDRAQYEFNTVRTIRGSEARTLIKWENDGWELVSQTPGRVRTEFVFRRPKPKTARDYLASAWVSFRGLKPAAQRGVLAASGALIAAVVVVGVIVGTHNGAEAQAVALRSDAATAPTTSAVPSAAPTAERSSEMSTPAAEKILTAHNSEDLAALLKADPGDDLVAEFAAKYEGRTIAFNGNIADVQHHADYTTRFDFLLNSGNFHEDTATGPGFQFRDKNIYDLNFIGSDIPDSVVGGENVRVIAEVGEYNSVNQLFQLTPISTRLR